MCASVFGDGAMVKILVDHGATIDHRNKVKDLEHVPTHSVTDHLMSSYHILVLTENSSYVRK